MKKMSNTWISRYWDSNFNNSKNKKVMDKTYDEIVKNANALDAGEKKAKDVSRTVKMKAKAKLHSDAATAEIAKLEAEEAYTKAVVDGGDIAKAALELKAAANTQEFYTQLLKTLFPSEATA